MRKLISLFVLVLAASTAVAGTDYWTWVDKNGVTNYAATRPDGVTNAKHIVSTQAFGQRTVDASDSDDANSGDQADDSGSDTGGPIDPDAAAAKDKAAIQAKIAKTKASNCSIGKQNLAKLESYPEIRVKDKDGTEHTLSQKERQDRMEQAKQIIRDNCAG